MNRLATNGHTSASDSAATPKPITGFTPANSNMDIARPDLARKRRLKRIAFSVVGIAALAIVTLLIARLEPAVPSVERGTLWTNTVQRGEMLRQVRGNGTLVPEQIQFVQAETGGTVERIHIQPGTAVEADSVILELSNPELTQQAFDAEWAAKAAEAQLAKLKVTLESERLAQEAALASLQADARQASLEAKASEALSKDGLVPAIELEKTRAKAADLANRVRIEEKRLQFSADSAKSQFAVQEAEVEKLRAVRELRRRQVTALRVKAGIAGVLSQLGDREVLQSGQRVAPSATLAKVVVPTRLKAEIRVVETQAKDITLGQHVDVDTRNGVVAGHVVRVDPAVQNGTVLVEVKLDGALPKGARPDLSIEGTIELERLTDVLHVGRPVQGQPDSTVGLFKVIGDGRFVLRVPVKLGRASVSSIEVIDGLAAGDVVVLNDMSQYDTHARLRLK